MQPGVFLAHVGFSGSGGPDSNRRHAAWKAATLPTELPPQCRSLADRFGRGDRTRTYDLSVPNAARYQLRYTPVNDRHRSIGSEWPSNNTRS